MYSTNLIFDIVPEVEEPEAEIGFMKPRINCSEQFSKSRKKYKNFKYRCTDHQSREKTT